VDPLGTWQYAQPVCFPSGARPRSNSLCWQSSTYGRSGCSPRQIAASPAAISSNVPPRCTVDASRHRGSFHGMEPSSAQSSLKAAGPCRKRRSLRA
jgi:hypothetical protein